MGAVDIAVLVTVCVAVAAVCGYLVYRKIKHKGGCCGCGGNCGSCSSCPHCHKDGADKK